MNITYFGNMATTYGAIYVFRNKINGKCYVGQSIDPEQRYRNHLSEARHRANSHFHRALKKYGIDNFDYFLVFAKYMPIELAKANLDEQERYWINFYDSFKNGYNSTTGGDTGCYHKKETIELISKNKMGHETSEETREKIRQTLTGRKQSEETKQKRKNSLKDRKWICLNNKRKRVKTTELDYWLNLGWHLGKK